MFSLFSHKEKISEELEGHLEEMTADFVMQGFSEDAARTKAEKMFGDPVALQKQLDALQEPFQHISFWLTLYAIGSLFFVLMRVLVFASLVRTPFESISLVWLGMGVTLAVLVVVRWIIDFFGLQSLSSLWTGYIFVALSNISLAAIIDINNFEDNIHAIALGMILLAIGNLLWRRFSLLFRRIVIFGYAALATTSVLLDRPVFQFLGYPRCFFLQYSTASASPVPGCEQVAWVHFLLVPLYMVFFVGIPYFLFFLIRYWSSTSTSFLRKFSLSVISLSFAVTPLMVNRVNSVGQLDVIPWKPQIYQAYQEILGRDPEQKDIDFYALTRSYTDLQKVREVLYQSYERGLKIRLLYLEILRREPTEAEIRLYLENRKSVEEIQKELSTQL